MKEPKAWIVSSKDRGRKSIKSGKVFLKDKEYFEIELFNPLKTCVLANIKLNGSLISKSGLILRPGQRFYLDCFIESNKKFVFNTYEVDNEKDSISATEKNGLLEVEFYKEEIIEKENWTNWINLKTYPTYHNGWWEQGVYYNQTNGTNTNISNMVNTTSTNAMYSSNIMNTDVDLSNPLSKTKSKSTRSKKTLSMDKVETGRVEGGQKSSQKFETMDMDFENFRISKTTIKILPESSMPVDTKKLSKTPNKNVEDIISTIEGLSKLYDSGILTEDEFTEKKTQLLNMI